ncbi:MAG: aminodeoxychorismate synthase component I [Saprospiraceae bacterium]
MKKDKFISKINLWHRNKTPFLFLINFELTKFKAYKLDKIPGDVFFDIEGITNHKEFHFLKEPDVQNVNNDIESYTRKYKQVMEEILYGNTFLINLTQKSEIQCTGTLLDLYKASNAKYKLYFKDQFIVFSPETFVKISNDRITTYPMKGTIDAQEINAQEALINDEKELAEHYTIVDLLRNDLSMVADKVKVDRFRYFDLIESRNSKIWQTSSVISGEIRNEFKSNIAELILTLLPAGSVSGAPKKKTVEIIQKVEVEPRGFYTGIMGVFDGTTLNSGVMIRFVEKSKNTLYYRSGGGITHLSDVEEEYQELKKKVYVPVRRKHKD